MRCDRLFVVDDEAICPEAGQALGQQLSNTC